MIIRKVFITGSNKQKFVTIPKNSEIKKGDYVEVIKINSQKEKKEE